MRSQLRFLAIALATSIACLTACDDPTRALSPDRSSEPVEQKGGDLGRGLNGNLRSYPEHAIADFDTKFTVALGDDIRPASYEWTFDDGAKVIGANASHTFVRSGTHVVRVRVTDQAGTVHTMVQSVSVGASIAALGSVMVGVVPGGLSACAVDATASVYCWGSNESGIVGDGTHTNRPSPTLVDAQGVAFSQIVSGYKHSCALSMSGEAYCWGKNAYGQLGDGTFAEHATPTLVLGGLSFTAIDVGVSHSCAITAEGAAYCWGSGVRGQLGDGSAASSYLTPHAVTGGRVFTVIRTGDFHTCALESVTGRAYCWGANNNGQIGNGTGGNSDTDIVASPALVTGGDSYTQLDVGGSHTCAISGKFTYCWGWNIAGQIGVTSAERCGGTRPCVRNPAKLAGSFKFSSVGLGTAHSCGLVGSTGAVFCWGFNGAGQLGDGTTVSKTTPTQLPGASMKSLRGGNGFTCAVGVDNKGYCWGLNLFGTLGVGDTTNRLTPTEIPGLTF
jgi:alpha-tubulin suppressor-like RCC1 family protein